MKYKIDFIEDHACSTVWATGIYIFLSVPVTQTVEHAYFYSLINLYTYTTCVS